MVNSIATYDKLSDGTWLQMCYQWQKRMTSSVIATTSSTSLGNLFSCTNVGTASTNTC